MKNINKKGISLIVLIITIIVVIILAAVVILTLSKNNPIESAKEAAFKEDIRAYQDELNMYITKEYQMLAGQRDSKITATGYEKDSTSEEYSNSVYKYLSSFKKKYENKIAIENDEIVYIGRDKKEREWTNNIVKMNAILTVKYVYENGEEAAPTYEEIVTDGAYEVDSPIIEGYEPDHYTVSDKIEKDKEVIVTYYPWSEGLAYEELNDGTYTVSGMGECINKNVIIPKTFNGKKVTQIKSRAFFTSNINSIVISDNIEIIGGSAFQSSSIETLVIGKNVKSLGGNFISTCSKLKSITFRNKEISSFPGCYGCPNFKEIKLDGNEDKYKVEDNILYTADGKKLIYCPLGKAGEVIIPDGVKTIVYGSFLAASINSIVVSDSVETIEGSAFQSSSIETLVIGKNVKSLGGNFISSCSKLKSITFRNKEISSFPACYGCPNFKEIKLDGNEDKYKVEDNILYTVNGEKLIYCPLGKAGEVIIPDSVKTIVYGSFFAASINSIVVSDSVETIEASAFQSSLIEKLVIGKNVKSMGGNFITTCSKLKSITFRNKEISSFPGCYGCPNFKEIKLDGNEDKYKIEDNILYTADEETLILCPYGRTDNVIILNTVKTIKNGAFYVSSLTEVAYNGTKSEWNNINKNGWNTSSKIKTIHCTDGDIQL